MATKKFGVSLPMDRSRQQNDKTYLTSANSRIPDVIWDRVLGTVGSYTTENGGRLIHPVISLTVEPSRILVDLEATIVDGVEGMDWYGNQFDSGKFHRSIQVAAKKAISWWRANRHNTRLVITEAKIEEVKT